jgi:tripartite-type tricarboxylate transporter receptor subunit TctC
MRYLASYVFDISKYLVLSFCLVSSIAHVGARAQSTHSDYPQKSIKLVVPYPPGGGADSLARVVASKMSKKLEQQVVVENKPGGNTAIASAYVATQPADGYTLLYVASSFAINPSLYKLRYSTENDFAPIALVAKVPLIIVTNEKSPIHNVKELIAYAKSKPGVLTYATYGAGSPVHLAGELFQSMTGTRLLHVPYKGSAPGLTDLMGGQVDLVFGSIEPSLQLMSSGKIRPIAVMTDVRIPAAPQVPTVAESDVPGFEANGWNGIVAPAGTPKQIVNRLNRVINEVVMEKDVHDRLAKQGVVTDLKKPEAFSQMINFEIQKWEKLTKDVNIKME